MGVGDDDQGDDDALHKVKAKRIAEQKVENDFYRLLHDVENDISEITHSKKNLVDDEKNTGLLKSKEVALISSKRNRSFTRFTPKILSKLKLKHDG